MPFEAGQAYECTDNGRRAVAVQIRSDGREGLLRFLDSGDQEWFLWSEGKWKLIRSRT
jgi:hypothetical protein